MKYFRGIWRKQLTSLQSKLPEGHFLIFLILGSDETPFSSHGGDKKGWPCFMGLGNLDSSVRNLPVARAFIQFATYPSIPKKPSTKIGKHHIKDWGANKKDVLQQTFAIVLRDLPKLYEEGIEINCSDGKKRIGHPILGGYICDYKECGTLFQVKADSCVLCEIPKNLMGSNLKGPARKPAEYKAMYSEFMNIKAALEGTGLSRNEKKRLRADRDDIISWFKARRVHLADRIFYDLPGVNANMVWKPDNLHTLTKGLQSIFLIGWNLFWSRQNDSKPSTMLG